MWFSSIGKNKNEGGVSSGVSLRYLYLANSVFSYILIASSAIYPLFILWLKIRAQTLISPSYLIPFIIPLTLYMNSEVKKYCRILDRYYWRDSELNLKYLFLLLIDQLSLLIMLIYGFVLLKLNIYPILSITPIFMFFTIVVFILTLAYLISWSRLLIINGVLGKLKGLEYLRNLEENRYLPVLKMFEEYYSKIYNWEFKRVNNSLTAKGLFSRISIIQYLILSSITLAMIYNYIEDLYEAYLTLLMIFIAVKYQLLSKYELDLLNRLTTGFKRVKFLYTLFQIDAVYNRHIYEDLEIPNEYILYEGEKDLIEFLNNFLESPCNGKCILMIIDDGKTLHDEILSNLDRIHNDIIVLAKIIPEEIFRSYEIKIKSEMYRDKRIIKLMAPINYTYQLLGIYQVYSRFIREERRRIVTLINVNVVKDLHDIIFYSLLNKIFRTYRSLKLGVTDLIFYIPSKPSIDETAKHIIYLEKTLSY